MPEILLKARNIEHVYEEGLIKTPVLKGVDLDIEASKMTAIVGKSGSGKSTLMHILGTLDTPTKGEIIFNGKDIIKLKSSEKAKFRNRYLGFVYQFHHLLGDFTALENVMLPLLIDNVEKRLAKDRATYLLERIGLSNHLKSLPSEMSGGERQRVAIVRALVHSPELILADEPTGNLDEANACTVFNLFKELVLDEGAAVVMVTHDRSLASQCDKIYEIVDGHIKEHVSSTEIRIKNSRQNNHDGHLDYDHGNDVHNSIYKQKVVVQSENRDQESLLADTEAMMFAQRVERYNQSRNSQSNVVNPSDNSEDAPSRYLEPTPKFTPEVSIRESNNKNKSQ